MNLQQEIDQLTKVLNNGELILYPTQTIWSLGCDASNEEAVQKLLQLKNRSPKKGLIVLLDDLTALKKYTSYIPPKASNLIQYYTRPLTIIYDNVKTEYFAASVSAPDGSVAIRITQNTFCKALIEAFGKPIVSTSANFTGEAYPKSFAQITPRLKSAVSYIADYGRRETSKIAPSTIVRIDGNELVFLRKNEEN